MAKAKKKKKTNPSIRKTKKRMKRLAGFKSADLTLGLLKRGRGAKPKRKVRPNPPKMKRLTRSTGWMDADKVKIEKRGGVFQVLVKRGSKKRRR